MRALLLAILLASPLAGCLGGGTDGGGPRLAAPTDKPVTLPNVTTPTRETVDLNDPGYLMTDAWSVGDGWDYRSNQSRFHTVRVLEERVDNGTRYYLIEETDGIIGNRPQTRLRTWVDGEAWARVNTSYVGGALNITFTPRAPDVRFHHNGTYQYNETRTILQNVTMRSTRANVLYAGLEKVRLPWGDVQAGRVESRIVRTAGEETTRELIVRHVAREFLNDVQYQLPTGEVYKLVAARAGARVQGVLQSS